MQELAIAIVCQLDSSHAQEARAVKIYVSPLYSRVMPKDWNAVKATKTMPPFLYGHQLVCLYGLWSKPRATSRE